MLSKNTIDAVGIRCAAELLISYGDIVGAMALDAIARELELGRTWNQILDDVEVKP